MNNNIRERINPKIWDPMFLLTYNNIKTFLYLMNLVDKNKNLKILDLGCGYKPFLSYFKDCDCKYIGIDFDINNSVADLFLDLNNDLIPFEDNSFDVIILSEVLEHLYNPIHVLKECRRIIKENGYIYVSTPFIFYYHGTPHDYYRYTEFFYQKISNELGLNIIVLNKAGNFFTTPIFTLNLTFFVIGKTLKIDKFFRLFFIFTNILIVTIEYLGNMVFNHFFKEKINYLNTGISLILQKNGK